MKLNTLFEGFSSRLHKAETDSSDMDSELSAHQTDYLVNELDFSDSFSYMIKTMKRCLGKYSDMPELIKNEYGNYHLNKDLLSDDDLYYHYNLHFAIEQHKEYDIIMSFFVEQYDNDNNLCNVYLLITIKKCHENEEPNEKCFKILCYDNFIKKEKLHSKLKKYNICNYDENQCICKSVKNVVNIFCDMCAETIDDAVDLKDVMHQDYAL